MVPPRRTGAEGSKTRAALLDAAEQIMVEDGYAAITSRKVGARAGLRSQLVHYYFPTMDDLFIALFRRRCDRRLEDQAKALESDQPLWTLWEFARDQGDNTVMMELVALAHHRKAIEGEIAAYAKRIRNAQIEGLSRAIEKYDLTYNLPPTALTVLIWSISQFLFMEETLGISDGHAETIDLVERHLIQLEGRRRRVPSKMRPRIKTPPNP